MTDVAPAEQPYDITDFEPGAHAEPVARLKHPRAIRWLHWVNFPLLAIMIWTGLRIYWAEDVYAFGIGSWEFFAFFPDAVYETLDLERRLARGMAFHFSFGWLFVINGIAYAVYLALSGEWRHILPDRRSLPEARDVVLHDLHIKSEAPPQGRYNAAQRISYTIVLAMALIVVVSGFAIYKPTQLHPLPLLFGGYQGARLVHFAMTIGIVLFFLVHILQVARAGWGNFRAMVTGYEIEQPDHLDRLAVAAAAEANATVSARTDEAAGVDEVADDDTDEPGGDQRGGAS